MPPKLNRQAPPETLIETEITMNDLLSSCVGLSLPLLTAQMPSTEQSAAIWWLFGLAAVAIMFNQISSAWARLSGKFAERPSIEPRAVTELACKDRHAGLDARLVKMEERLQSSTEALRLEVKGDIKGVHSRVDDILGAVRELSGRLSGRHISND